MCGLRRTHGARRSCLPVRKTIYKLPTARLRACHIIRCLHGRCSVRRDALSFLPVYWKVKTKSASLVALLFYRIPRPDRRGYSALIRRQRRLSHLLRNRLRLPRCAGRRESRGRGDYPEDQEVAEGADEFPRYATFHDTRISRSRDTEWDVVLCLYCWSRVALGSYKALQCRSGRSGELYLVVLEGGAGHWWGDYVWFCC